MPNLKPLPASAKVILQFQRVEEDKEDDVNDYGDNDAGSNCFHENFLFSFVCSVYYVP